MINSFKITFCLILLMLLNACATYNAQYKSESHVMAFPNKKEISHSFYLIGDAGNSPIGKTSEALKDFKIELEKASKNSTAIFLGDNIYPKGLPKKSDGNRAFAEHQLNIQTDAVKYFKGETIFLPGNHDWYSNGLKGLKRQEEYVEKRLGKNTFLPENGCPIENIHVSDDIELILIDSEWYMTNWDKQPTINDNCDIKTRISFFDEFGSLIKKARGKTTIVAVHHPMYTNGSHGGQFSVGSHLKPVPVLGTVKNVIRKTSGLITVDIQNKRYREFKKHLVTMAQHNDKVVFVSGHEHNLQYLVQDNLRQIVSGSGSKLGAVRNVEGGEFAHATSGFVRLDVFKDGSSYVRFYSSEEDKIVFETEVLQPNQKIIPGKFKVTFPERVSASIYTDEETKASSMKKLLWGNRYRDYYSTKISAPAVDLDTLFGGLTPVRKGGGNQSKSLRLQDKNGAQYVMRALRKNALQYLQAVLFKDQYIEGQFNDTGTEALLLDVFAGSHPYAPFTIGTLSDAVGVYHTNPVLYYIPKQNGLGHYNDEFGDELYMIEEHTSEGHSDLASFGFQDKLVGTDDVMKKIHKDEDIIIDEASYIRARLFDMLIGDWDRHQDQWRWIEFKENGKKVYRPMPRDRDQAFSVMSDGLLLGAAVKLVPTARLLRKYDDDLVDVKGVNVEPYPLDMEFIQQSEKAVWDAQVKAIQIGLTDDAIEKAFLFFPEEVRDETVEEIKRKLKARRGNLQKISDRYYDLLNKFVVIKGTNKDDYFTINCLENGNVEIFANRIKNGKKEDQFHKRTYNSNITREIWIYALDDDDIFEVIGKSKNIKLRLIGGQNNDTYKVANRGKVIIYDYKSKENTISEAKKATIKLSDNYETNVYNYKKLKNSTNQLIPSIGSNPDDGFKIGINNTFTAYGFERNPFTSQHSLSAAYYVATKGYELNYKGEFANIINNWNLGLDTKFSSPNYAINFFGFGNESTNLNSDNDDMFDLDYNRIKIGTFKISPSLIWRGQLGASFKVGLSYETNKVERTQDRYIESITTANNPIFDRQAFYGAETTYHFKNQDNEAFPTLGMETNLQVGYKMNADNGNQNFGYIIPTLGFDYKLVPNGKLVLATKLKGHLTLGNGFEFYQGAALGANNGLRGYRNQRFTGKHAFSQNIDLRFNFRKLKTGIMPLNIGVYGGFDYAHVWFDNNNTDKWNNSFGGGLFANMANLMTANISAFNSNDGMRFAFKMGFGF